MEKTMKALENLLKYLPANSRKQLEVHLIGPSKRPGGRPRKLTAVQESELIREYTRGSTLKETGDKFNVSTHLVLSCLKREGIPRRRQGQRFISDDSTVYRVGQMMGKGLTQAEMAKEIGCTRQRVCQIIKQYY
jgi:hypothetical protein